LVDSVGEIEGGTQMMLDEVIHRADPTRVSLTIACLTDGSWPRRLIDEGFRVHVLQRTRWRDVGNVIQVARQLRDVIRRERIELVHGNENSTMLYASLAGRWAGVPVVWNIYDPLTGPSLKRRISSRLLASLRPSWIIFGTIVASGGVPRGRSIPTSTILPGIDLARHSGGDGTRARAQLGIDADAPVVVTFGRLDYYKSQLDFILAMAQVVKANPGVRGVLCGWESESQYSRSVRRTRAELGLDETVTITGFVPDDVKDDIMAAADVVVHVARREPFGLVVIEAMAAAKPVVAADAAGPRSLIDDGVTGVLVPIGDISSISAAINSLLADPARRVRLGVAAQAEAQRHSVADMVTRTEGVWDEVLS
jgi:glycosyltransferase involved in cell wall biosynthesis